MRTTNWNIVKKAIGIRTKMLHTQRDIINSSPKLRDEAILIASRNMVSKHYKEIANELGIEVVFNSGGAQTQKMLRLDKDGTEYVWIEPKHLSKEEDILNGF